MLEWKYYKDAVDKKEEARDSTVSGGGAQKRQVKSGFTEDVAWIWAEF